MHTHAVVIAGGGPTGLVLAGELALARIDVAIVERRASQDLIGARAGGLHARTIEVFDQRGIADRFLSEGQKAQVAGFGGVSLDISDFPTRHPYGLGLWQDHIERILAGWVGELAVPIYRGREMTGFAQDDTGVDVQLSDGTALRADYLVGCDGGRSLVRKAAGIEFPGWDATTSNLIAEVEMTEEPPLGTHRTALGIHGFGRREYEIRDGKVIYKNEGPVRVGVPERLGAVGEPTLGDLSAALIAVCGTDYGVHSPTSISRFTDTT
jgi:2-polyprenyl-6-methoxyphenol hydroxylase-like FAD-dependent oxidoreductase